MNGNIVQQEAHSLWFLGHKKQEKDLHIFMFWAIYILIHSNTLLKVLQLHAKVYFPTLLKMRIHAPKFDKPKSLNLNITIKPHNLSWPTMTC